jgi:hypothetical protein
MRSAIPLRARPEEQLILLSAGTTERRRMAAAQLAALGRTVDWSLMTELLRERRLLALLGPRLVQLAEPHAGNRFAATVDQALDAGRRHGVFLQMIAARVATALADAGIRCAPLKGPALSEMLHGDPGRRISSDVDLLVAHRQLHDAVDVVRGLGYAAPTDSVDREGLPLLHFALIHEQGLLPPIELHWRIHWYERSFAGERLLPPEGEFAQSWRPAAIDELAALLIFYARDGFIDLRLATDLSAWWDAFGASLDSGALEGLIRTYPALEHVLRAAAKVGQNIVGLQIPAPPGRKVKLSGRSQIAIRLATPYPHVSEAQLLADVGLIDGLLTPRGGFWAFVRRRLVPPPDVLREHARRTQRRRASSGLGHSVRVLARYALAMGNLLRARNGSSPG